MSKNILIVESDNDKFFIEAFIKHLNSDINLKIEQPICNINDYECLEGLSKKKLKTNLKFLKRRIEKDGEEIKRVGIIIDSDKKSYLSEEENSKNGFGIENRINLINETLKEIFFIESDLTQINQFTKGKIREELEVEFSCYITNINGIGELETLLKELACKDSTYADCLESWQKCLKDNNKKDIKLKDFNKFWIQVYQRYDCCNSNEKKQADRKCNNEISMQKGIYDFNHKSLIELKTFLYQFN